MQTNPPDPESVALSGLRYMRSQLAMYDFLLPGDFIPEPPMRRNWFGRKRPMPVHDDLLCWAGELARARSLMDVDEAISIVRSALQSKETK